MYSSKWGPMCSMCDTVCVSVSSAGKCPHHMTGHWQSGLLRVVFPLLVVVAYLEL